MKALCKLDAVELSVRHAIALPAKRSASFFHFQTSRTRLLEREPRLSGTNAELLPEKKKVVFRAAAAAAAAADALF